MAAQNLEHINEGDVATQGFCKIPDALRTLEWCAPILVTQPSEQRVSRKTGQFTWR